MNKIEQLNLMANKLRISSMKSTTEAGSGHPTSCMSCAEIMSTLFFSELGGDDEFILSKGHAAPILWAAYAEAGCIPAEDHYCNALGSLISSVIEKVRYLCVRDIPRSGKPEELLEKYGIDASAIVKMVEQMV